MTLPKSLQYFLLIIILPFVFCTAYAQGIDENTYQHKMQLMDSLSFYNMKDYDTLYHVSILNTIHGYDYKNDYYGWIKKRNHESILFINVGGTEIEIEKKHITKLNSLPIIDTTIEGFKYREENEFPAGHFGKNYLLNLWLYEKGKFDYSKQLLPKNDQFFSDDHIRDGFGIIYYDAMLLEFTGQRNYPKAIEFGNHLSGNIFNGYEYQKEAIALTQQLKTHTEDFKTFLIPDSLQWATLKQKLNKNQQILYLADRLRLLNCIQPGQPAGISYDMYQYSISYDTAQKLDMSYWDYNTKYAVINPFSKLLQMNLNLHETELLLPYLLSESYIPSYSYHRDFFSERTLQKLSWVVSSLIFEITNQRFFNQSVFDSLSTDQKKADVEKIKKWCDENSGLSKEELIINVLKTTNQWVDFRKAVETARQEKYQSLLPVIAGRFNDFKDMYWPVHKYLIAETMYELGDEKYISTVKQWNKDTTQVEVKLWLSLFLLKNDKSSYESAMNELEAVLKKCDGTAYYPHAMDLLLCMNDNRALKLAEGILDKPQFPNFIYWDYYLNFVKKLLCLKSDYTFNLISKKLDSFTPEEIQLLNNNGNTNMFVQSDFFVLAVDKLKSNKTGYNPEGSIETRLKYKKALSEWFSTQYDLLKQGKPNELLLNIVPVNAPVSFIDAAR